MKFESITGTAFGALRGQRLELAPGMTVVHGPNEAGKSTWFAALYAGLAGRKVSRGRQAAPQRDFRRRHKPWTGSAWKVELTVALDSGRRLHLAQNLMDCSVRLTDASTDEYISITALENEIGMSLESDGSFDGACLIGLDRDAVRSTLFVGQADVLAVLRNASELQRHLQRAAASTHIDTTAEEALQRIREQRSTRVGVPHIGNRPLRSLTAAVTKAGEEADSALETRHRLLTEQMTLTANIADATRATARLAELEALAVWVEIDQLASRASAARELQQKLEGERVATPADEASIRRVAGIVERFINRGERPVEPTGPSAADLQAQIDALPEFPSGPHEPESDVLALEHDLLTAVAALESLYAGPVVPPELAAVEATPEEIRRIAECLTRESPKLRAGIREEIRSLHQELDVKRSGHERRVAEYEAAVSRYNDAQQIYVQRLRAYETERAQFAADEAEYHAQVESYNVARSRRDSLRADHERVVNDDRVNADRRKSLGGFAIGLGALLGVAAVLIGIFGTVTFAVILGVMSIPLIAGGAAVSSRRSAAGVAPEFREVPLPTVRDRPDPPVPPEPPVPLTLMHPGEQPGPSAELIELERELDAWQTLSKEHTENVTAALAAARELGISVDPAELRHLARSIEDHDAATARYVQYMNRIKAADESVRAAIGILLERLGSTSLVASAEELIRTVSDAVHKYKQECAARAEQALAAERKPGLLLALDQRKQRDVEYRNALTTYRAVAAELIDAAAKLGYEGVTEAEALEALDDWLGVQRDLEEKRARANLDVGKLEQLLEGATIEALEAEIEARRQTAPARPLHVDPDDLAQLENARHAKSAADGDVQETRRAIKDLQDLARPIAAAVEQELRLSKSLDEVRQLDRFLALAEEHLRTARERAHADIAPALADTMRPWVPKVTAGRYLDLIVEPEDLRLFAFDANGRKVEVDVLSHGTTEQLFLLLRIALAVHLSRAEESVPLVLDDVTVQADPERTQAILELLHELSVNHQVVLFTQEPEVVQWATENLESTAVVTL